MHHGSAAIAVNATRGARPLRPFARGALPPALQSSAWPKQLQYDEAVNARFRQLLSSPTKVPELVRAPHDVLSYLREWADRADPSHTAELKTASKGGRPTSLTRGCSSFLSLSSTAACWRRTTSQSVSARRRSR